MPKANDKRMIARLLPLFWPGDDIGIRLRVVGTLLLVLSAKLIGIGAPLVYRRIIDGMQEPAAAAVPVMLIIAYGLSYVGTQVTGTLRQLVFADVAQRAARLIAVQVFRHLHGLSLRFHLDRRTGGVSRVVDRGTNAIEYLLELAMFTALPTLLELALVAGILWHLYAGSFALTIVATLSCYGLFTAAATRWQIRHRREMNSRDVAANVRAIDSLLNYETIKYFGAEEHEIVRYDRAKAAYAEAALSNQRAQTLLMLGQAIIICAGLILVMLAASRRVAVGDMTIGDFVLVNAYLLQLYVPLGALATIYSSIRQASTDVEAMLHLLGERPEIVDRPGAPALAVCDGDIRFDGVSFAYDARRPILDDISFTVRAGQTVAIVGATGSGKSTLARLLFRFYDVEAGRIAIDGQDIRDISQSSLRRAFGVVPQDTVLFNDTIGYNIGYADPAADRSVVERAARQAHLHDFVMSLPDGYDTMVGERGLKLSGGEKQRVAIARVFLKNPPLLILDEATSALDSRTEQDIQASLDDVSIQRSTLIIAHRLSTVLGADQILVLDHGRIVERGDHHALLALGGHYAAMWRRQQRAVRHEQVDA